MSLSAISLKQSQLERTPLKDQTAALLRDVIVRGRIKPGTKITERDVAELLNISRMPARDALMALEREGLVISKPSGRYVIELGEQDIRHLYQIRITLEKLAVELAIGNVTADNLRALEADLDVMRRAVAEGDTATYAASDLAIHEGIWQLTGNPHLVEMLHSMLGPISMFIATQARMVEDWQESLRLHEQLITMIAVRDTAGAIRSIEAHVKHSRDLSLAPFRR